MKPTPKGWPRLSSALTYQDAAAAIDWLCRAFGFELRLKVEGDGGRIEHSELTYGEAVVMVSQAGKHANRPGFPPTASPKAIGGVNTQSLFVYVDDVDAHYRTALAAGATMIYEPEVHDYGPEYWSDRGYGVLDCEGHSWWFSERLRG